MPHTESPPTIKPEPFLRTKARASRWRAPWSRLSVGAGEPEVKSTGEKRGFSLAIPPWCCWFSS